MLEIKPVQSADQHEQVCRDCTVAYDADNLCYAAYEGERLIGISEFVIKGKYGYIRSLKNANGVDDLGALFIAARATLNFIDLHGVHEAFFEAEDSCPDERFIKWVGFSKDAEGRWYMDLNGFFEEPCKHENKE